MNTPPDWFFQSVTHGAMLGFALFMVWASIDYNRLIGLWVPHPPPYSKRVRTIFRILFVVWAAAGIWGFLDMNDWSGPRIVREIPYAIAVFLLMCAMLMVVGAMNRFHSRRKGKSGG